MRKFIWVVPIVAAVYLIAYFLVTPWFLDRGVAFAIESLTAALKTAGEEIDKAIADVSKQATVNDLERSTKRFGELNK